MYVPPWTELQQIPKPARVKGERWGFCGIAAMSAATGVPPLTIHSMIPDWPGYTPSRTIIATLDKLGYDCKRVLLPKDVQQKWPGWSTDYPSGTALGRIYFGEGKFANSHWFTLHWKNHDLEGSLPAPGMDPMVYDNADDNFRHKWQNSWGWNFWPAPVKLKSLYFVIRKSVEEFEGVCLH